MQISPFLHFQQSPIYYVPGFPVEALLQSTLECLFDWSCLKTIHTFIPSSNITDATPLDTNKTRFTPNTSIRTIVSSLFIENWTTEQSFSDYYAQFAPNLCTYTSVHHNNVLYIITKLSGLCGELSAVRRLCIPFMIERWRKTTRNTLTVPGRSEYQYIKISRFSKFSPNGILFSSFFTYTMPSSNTRTMHTDPLERTTLRISTWIYLILLCLSMIIIVLFTSLSVQIHHEIIEDLSIVDFEYLPEKYTRSIQCPCSEIIIPHYSFISLSPQFHLVCTSDFLSDLWFNSIAEAGWPQKLTKTIVLDALSIFNHSSLITDQRLSRAELIARIRHAFNQFPLDTVAEVTYSIALVQSQISTMYTTGQSDAFWKLSPWHNRSHSKYCQTVSKQLGKCSCAFDGKCKLEMILYNYTNYLDVDPLRPIFKISNMFVGCFPIQSLLQSSLECMFDQTCLDPLVNQMKNIIAVARKLNISILQWNSTRFFPKTLIQEIINEMRIETWNENINYSKYYAYCAPKRFPYSYILRDNAIYGFITMIGLFGGLSSTLRIIVPSLVHRIRNKNRTRGQRNNMSRKSD
ncbi:unnamed protein product [Adineta ricciae]|uniref:Uncharacterized protein n=1 Tax=Adineta ricciae TaxID=249248 RepID=A0A814VRJ9_ADIRI|nr:unnamed protein product [Adineta ricciae]